jgi:divalent metal cation (Fe/Co/Zn/Cd) transporter
VAGLIVTGFIAHVGWEVTSELVVHLIDGVDPVVLRDAERGALAVPGVEHVHVRARWIGRSLIIDIEGFVPGATTVHAAERIGRQVEQAVEVAVPESRAALWAPRTLPMVG